MSPISRSCLRAVLHQYGFRLIALACLPPVFRSENYEAIIRKPDEILKRGRVEILSELTAVNSGFLLAGLAKGLVSPRL